MSRVARSRGPGALTGSWAAMLVRFITYESIGGKPATCVESSLQSVPTSEKLAHWDEEREPTKVLTPIPGPPYLHVPELPPPPDRRIGGTARSTDAHVGSHGAAPPPSHFSSSMPSTSAAAPSTAALPSPR